MKEHLGYKDKTFNYRVEPNFAEFEKTVAKRGQDGIEEIRNRDHRIGAGDFIGWLKNQDYPGQQGYSYCNFTIVEGLG